MNGGLPKGKREDLSLIYRHIEIEKSVEGCFDGISAQSAIFDVTSMTENTPKM